jgi:hypothetical protein
VAETEGAASRQKVAELVDAVKKASAAAMAPLNSFFKTAFNGASDRADQLRRDEPQEGANQIVAGEEEGADPGAGQVVSAALE